MKGNSGEDPTNPHASISIDRAGTGFLKMFYTGSSMNPTLKEPDILHVLPHERGSIRPGDVIVYRPPGSTRLVVHRVARVDEHGIRTMGDNNSRYDAYVLDRGDVMGRVVYAERGLNRRRIFGGTAGLLFGIAARLRRLALRLLSAAFRNAYRGLARSGVVSRRLPSQWHPRLVCFPRKSGNEYQLILRGRVIGRLLPHKKIWRIHPPFRLFVDEESLPRGTGEPENS